MHMTPKRVVALLLCCTLALGCSRTPTANAPSNANLTPEQRVTHAVPALQRTVNQNDLNQLKLLIQNAHAESGKYPKTLAELPGLDRDLPAMAKAIQDGEVVLAGGQGGVLAYEKSALTDRGSVL